MAEQSFTKTAEATLKPPKRDSEQFQGMAGEDLRAWGCVATGYKADHRNQHVRW